MNAEQIAVALFGSFGLVSIVVLWLILAVLYRIEGLLKARQQADWRIDG